MLRRFRYENLTGSFPGALLVRHRRGDDEKNEISQPRILDAVLDPRRDEDHVMAPDDLLLAGDLHQALAFEYVIDLLLHLVGMPFDIGHWLVAGNPVVELFGVGRVGRDQRLGQRAAEVARARRTLALCAGSAAMPRCRLPADGSPHRHARRSDTDGWTRRHVPARP